MTRRTRRKGHIIRMGVSLVAIVTLVLAGLAGTAAFAAVSGTPAMGRDLTVIFPICLAGIYLGLMMKVGVFRGPKTNK